MKNLILLFVLAIICPSFVASDLPNEGKFINVFETPQIVEIGKTLRLNKCNNKYYVPVALPKNAKGWIYSVTTISKNEVAEPQSALFEEVLGLADKHEPSKVADFITHKERERDFNFYILQEKDNAESFFNCGCYKYVQKYIGTKSRSAYVEKSNDETFYIAIENNKDLKNLRLKIEVVAVVE